MVGSWWGLKGRLGGGGGGGEVFSSVVRHLLTPNVPEPTGASGPSSESRPVGAKVKWGRWEEPGRGEGL